MREADPRVNRSRPIFGSVNLSMPWEKKISPTAMRMKIVLREEMEFSCKFI